MAITSDELQSIVSAVLSSIRTNSRTIDQLTPVTALADTDNLEVHGGKRVVFSILRNLILSKSGVDELKTELKPKLAELDDVVEIHSVRSDIGVILAQPSGPLTVYHGSTDEGYGVVYDSTRKRFYLVGTSTLPNPNTDVSVIQAYGDWSDEAVFGDSPESGSGRIPVRGKLYVCATDGGLYYWNGTDLVDLIKGILANTNALSILNRRGQVEPFAAVLTTDPDDDPIPEELVGKRVWSTQFNKFLEINIGGDPPYREPEDSAAVVDKFYVCDGRLYLGVKVSQTATTLKPLFDSEIEQLSRTHSITLTAGDDGTLSWSGANFNNMRNGDVIEWENMGVLFRGTVISRTSSGSYDTLAVVYDFDGDEPLELHVLWIRSNGTATDACFSSDQTLASVFNAKQTKLEDTTDIYIEGETTNTDGLYLKDSAKRAVFNDEWAAAGGTVIVSGVTYGLNGINDLTYEEAMEIMLVSGDCLSDANDYSRKFAIINCRTIFPIKATGQHLIDYLAYKSTNLEVIAFALGLTIKSLNCYSAFNGCKKLKKIIGEIKANLDVRFFNIFDGCEKLEDVTIRHIHQNISFKDSPLLSIGSLTYLVTYRQGSNPITVTVHADTFAKLTGDTTNPAVAALTPSELTQWQQILTAATAKNISFTTP